MANPIDLVKATADLTKALVGYFNPSSYEARVLRGLVGTGDNMMKYASAVYNRAKAVGISSTKEDMKYLRHYMRKWESDRSKLR